ncbi:MAG: HAD family hydrolase, partial [bacterium]
GHFTYYASRLRSKLPAERQKLFADDYKNVLNNKHILKIGRTYDVDRDLIILHADKVSAAYQWDGTRIPNEKLETLYPEPVSFDMEKMINIGDLWWVPAAIALHYGLNSKETYQAFLKTREYMKGPNYDINQVPGLREILSKLRNNLKLILMTNSPRPDSEAILDKLSLNSLFDLKIFNAGKPALTQKQFMKLSEKLEIDYPEILSIGDNYLNEILPAKQLGCKTIFIDSYKLGLEEEEEFYVKSCSQLVDYLQSLVI